MTEYTMAQLVQTRRNIIESVEKGDILVSEAAQLLGITRQGVYKIRKRVKQYGWKALLGRKRGPKRYRRAWNRTGEKVEKRVVDLFEKEGVGPDRLSWRLEDEGIKLHRSTIYRILVRKGVHKPREKAVKEPAKLYTKDFPGEEVQVDSTEPFGKGADKPILYSAVDDYTRWGWAALLPSLKATDGEKFLYSLVASAPFPIRSVRIDNGGEFKAAFRRAARRLNIKLIINPPRTPERNGKVERFHRIVEEECLWRVKAKPDNLSYARYWLSRWNSWYNEKRRHGGYGMDKKTPKQKLEDWIKDNINELDVNETVVLYNI